MDLLKLPSEQKYNFLINEDEEFTHYNEPRAVERDLDNNGTNINIII